MSATVWTAKERQPGRLHLGKVAYVEIQDKEDDERTNERARTRACAERLPLEFTFALGEISDGAVRDFISDGAVRGRHAE